MDATCLPDALAPWAASHDVTLHPSTTERLTAYVAALLDEGQRINLSAARDPDKAWAVLVRPSLAIALAVPPEGPGRALDLGSGNGFPGVVVAALWPAADVVLLERRGRKAQAIERVAERAGFRNVRVVAHDARDLVHAAPELLGTMDLVTARAVGPLGEATRMAAPLLAAGGRVVHWKRSTTTSDEHREGARVARGARLAVMPEITPDAGESARLIVYRRARG